MLGGVRVFHLNSILVVNHNGYLMSCLWYDGAKSEERDFVVLALVFELDDEVDPIRHRGDVSPIEYPAQARAVERKGAVEHGLSECR